jgi:hypothetical protein
MSIEPTPGQLHWIYIMDLHNASKDIQELTKMLDFLGNHSMNVIEWEANVVRCLERIKKAVSTVEKPKGKVPETV